MMQAQAVTNQIDLKGSTEIVCEFFNCAINSILYQRNVWDPDEFETVPKYNLKVLLTTDPDLKRYLNILLNRTRAWLKKGQLSNVIMLIENKRTKEVLERWDFKISTDEECVKVGAHKIYSQQRVEQQIRKIIFQITSLNSALPSLEEECSIDFQFVTSGDAEAPSGWRDAEEKKVEHAEETIQLCQLNTNVHKLNGCVTYKNRDWDIY